MKEILPLFAIAFFFAMAIGDIIDFLHKVFP